MDTLYIGKDIPSSFHYAIFNNGYIDLYDQPVLHNNTYNYYRIFTNVDGFFYDTRSTSVGQYTTTYTTNINVSDNPCYRQDFDSVLFCTFIFVLFGVWLLNIMTSLFRKGGVFGGLL